MWNLALNADLQLRIGKVGVRSVNAFLPSNSCLVFDPHLLPRHRPPFFLFRLHQSLAPGLVMEAMWMHAGPHSAIEGIEAVRFACGTPICRGNSSLISLENPANQSFKFIPPPPFFYLFLSLCVSRHDACPERACGQPPGPDRRWRARGHSGRAGKEPR